MLGNHYHLFCGRHGILISTKWLEYCFARLKYLISMTLNIVKKRGQSSSAKFSPVSAAERKRSTETLIYSLCLRAAYLAAKSDVGNWFDTVAVNATQKWNDAATGQPREGIIASLQAQKGEIASIKIQQVDPKACFRHMKGLSTPSTENVTPIRPIFVLNKDDKRIVQERDVTRDLETEANIAAMPWEDFEHLVRQLFEWEFGRNGVEVKVFRLFAITELMPLCTIPIHFVAENMSFKRNDIPVPLMLLQLEICTAQS